MFNPFKKGFCSDEERAETFSTFDNGFVVVTSVDPNVKDIHIYDVYPPRMHMDGVLSELAKTMMCFGARWHSEVWGHLNGFQGLDCPKYVIHHYSDRLEWFSQLPDVYKDLVS